VPQFHAECIDKAVVGRPLARVIGLDALARELEGRERVGIARLYRRRDFTGAHLETAGCDVDTVEAARQLDQRVVAARNHVGDDRPRGLLHVLGNLALGVEKSAEALGKIGNARVQPEGHHGSMA